MPDINNPTAAKLMTRSVVSILAETPVHDIALLLAERSISAVPVVDSQGQVLGMVTEADLVRRLAGLADTKPEAEAPPAGDDVIREAVVEALRGETWSSGYYSSVAVTRGVVSFEGFCQVPGSRRGMHVLALGVPGVRGVVDNTVPMPMAYVAGI